MMNRIRVMVTAILIGAVAVGCAEGGLPPTCACDGAPDAPVTAPTVP